MKETKALVAAVECSTQQQPCVTIGVATFNAAGTVERAVRSALAQTWRSIEIVAADDCSTDATLEVLQALEARHSEVRVVANPENTGVAGARNRILAAARGEFLAFFDDDDESLPERVAAQVERIVEYERDFARGAPVVCNTARRMVWPDGAVRIERTMGQAPDRGAPFGPAVARRILLGSPLRDGYGACPTCSQMARLETYRSLGGFDPALRRGEDTDFNVRLAEAGGHFVGIAQPLVVQTMAATPDKNLDGDFRAMLAIMEKHRASMERAGQFEFRCRWIEAKRMLLEGRRGAFIRAMTALSLERPYLVLRGSVLALRNLGTSLAYGRLYRDRK